MHFCSKGPRDKVRVLYLSYNGLLEPLLYSQVIAYLKELTRRLNIEIVVLSFEKLGFFLSSKERQRIKSLKEELLRGNIHWHWLRYHKSPAILSTVYDIFLGVLAGCNLILREKIKFIHARSYVPAVIAYILSKLFKTNYVFDMRGFMIDDYVALEVIPHLGLVHRIAKVIEKTLLENSTHTVVLTEVAKTALRDLSKADMRNRRVEVIPCCVDTRRFDYRHTKDRFLLKKNRLEGKFIFIYAGSLGKLYEFDKMLDFFNVARNIIPNAHFLILTPDINFVEERAKNNNDGLFDNISYLRVNPYEIGKYMSLADIGIAFYLPSFSRKATSPTKIGEYLASGIPFAVNSGVGDTEKWIEQFKIGVVVKDFTAECYKNSIDSLLNLIKEKKEIKKVCRDVSEKILSLDIATRKYAKIYRFLISQFEGSK